MNSHMNMVQAVHTFQSANTHVTSRSSCQPSASFFIHYTILSQLHDMMSYLKNKRI
jgi:hypothetical protein